MTDVTITSVLHIVTRNLAGEKVVGDDGIEPPTPSL